MNLANKLTIMRAIAVPFFVFFLLSDVCGAAGDWIALAIFIIAAFTDLFDGKLARKYGMVTNFGKFMDPLADKLLVCSALICLVYLGRLQPWIAIIIIAREFIISGLRMVASEQGIVIAASWWGKIKTVIQMVMIGFLIGYVQKPVVIGSLKIPFFTVTTEILVWTALALTLISLADYIWKNRQVLQNVD